MNLTSNELCLPAPAVTEVSVLTYTGRLTAERSAVFSENMKGESLAYR